jgi:hypothetical protein
MGCSPHRRPHEPGADAAVSVTVGSTWRQHRCPVMEAWKVPQNLAHKGEHAVEDCRATATPHF